MPKHANITRTLTNIDSPIMNKEEEEPICIECDKKNQKDLPTSDSSSSDGMPCQQIYMDVNKCMNENDGLISACREPWDAFKQCHSQQKQIKDWFQLIGKRDAFKQCYSQQKLHKRSIDHFYWRLTFFLKFDVKGWLLMVDMQLVLALSLDLGLGILLKPKI